MFMLKQYVLALVLLVPLQLAAQLPDFTDLVEKHGAAVVNISTTQTKGSCRLTCCAHDTFALNHSANGAAIACDRPTAPKAMPMISIRSVRLATRSCCAW